MVRPSRSRGDYFYTTTPPYQRLAAHGRVLPSPNRIRDVSPRRVTIRLRTRYTGREGVRNVRTRTYGRGLGLTIFFFHSATRSVAGPYGSPISLCFCLLKRIRSLTSFGCPTFVLKYFVDRHEKSSHLYRVKIRFSPRSLTVMYSL